MHIKRTRKNILIYANCIFQQKDGRKLWVHASVGFGSSISAKILKNKNSRVRMHQRTQNFREGVWEKFGKYELKLCMHYYISDEEKYDSLLCPICANNDKTYYKTEHLFLKRYISIGKTFQRPFPHSIYPSVARSHSPSHYLNKPL